MGSGSTANLVEPEAITATHLLGGHVDGPGESIGAFGKGPPRYGVGSLGDSKQSPEPYTGTG